MRKPVPDAHLGDPRAGARVGATGELRLLLTRELGTTAINDALWATVISLLQVAWFGSWTPGLILGAAVLINLLRAALAGLPTPPLLHRIGIDPTLAGSVILTTVTDVIGCIAVLGLPALWLT